MNKTFILYGCFLPLVTIFIFTKFVVWITAANSENSYVRKEHSRKRGKYVENPYADVDEEEEEYGDRTDYR